MTSPAAAGDNAGAPRIDVGPRMRLYRTSEPTPCQTVNPARSRNAEELWFSQFKDRIHAIRECQRCPFLGRCGYNAVVAREEYGVWGGISLPGDKNSTEMLEAAYKYLLAQFEQRLPIEQPGLPMPALPSPEVAHRRKASAKKAA